MFFFKADTKDKLRPWPHIGMYQNSTLRYAPGEDFPTHLERIIGRPKIMRCFLTMDDAWDYRTGEYRYDYDLGIDPYADDPNMYRYEREEQKISPYGMSFEKYLTSHAHHADYIMLAVRRYEREVAEGVISLDQYEIVLEHLLEYYKELAPNIRYIEGNEWNIPVFGKLTPFEAYALYKKMYSVVNRLNQRHQYCIPLEVGGPTNFGCVSEFPFYERFLRLYKLDDDPEKRIDFYASHEYSESMATVPEYYRMHHELIKKLGLPDKPIFFDEYGTAHFRPDPYYNQLNAAASIEMFITVASYEELHIFPWCTYHDPDIQVSHTMFIDFSKTCGYLPTFLGQAHIAMSRLYDYYLPLMGSSGNRAVVTTDGRRYAILVANRDGKQHNIRYLLTNLPGMKMKVDAYKVDALHNNCFIDRSISDLMLTDSWDVIPAEGQLTVSDSLDALSFILWIITPYD